MTLKTTIFLIGIILALLGLLALLLRWSGFFSPPAASPTPTPYFVESEGGLPK